MTHAFINVVIPFRAAREEKVNALLDSLGKIEGHGKSTRPTGLSGAARRELRRFVHFMSLVVIPADGAPLAHLVVEACADGAADDVLARLSTAAGDVLLAVAKETGHKFPASTEGLLGFLQQHRIEVGTRLFANPGLEFSGTPGMSVQRIRLERLLALKLRRILERRDLPSGSALKRLRFARRQIFASVNFKWAFVSEPIELLGTAKSKYDLFKSLALAAWNDYLWALLPVPLLVALYSALNGNPANQVLWHFLAAAGIEIALVLLIFAAGYRMLRRQEDEDVPIDAEPEKARMEEILAYENRPGVAQNHLAGVSILKRGPIRRVSLRVALWLVAELQRGLSRPGFLNRIGTIHFARWLLLPGTDRLVFLSNYDGSWQSYLEDFIARLREGLTSVWSNTRDFPKTENLFIGGAGDGTRFKRWARRQQVPTRFWFSAYPQLATDRIRTNAAIRHGFASASDENAAAQWLEPFGYAAPQNVEKEEIPTLAFGGLPDFRFARCLIIRFGDRTKAREWLREVRGDVSHGEHVPLGDRALVAAFSSGGLATLGLDSAALATFPAAFQQGMSAPGRSRALGDEKTDQWLWGGLYASGPGPGAGTSPSDERAVHAALLLYAKHATRLASDVGEHKRKLDALGHKVLLEINLKDLPERDPVSGEREIREPFGFRDGVSQPIMRGSKQWSRREYAMHVVEPGELVLGYRDNLGNLSPTPCHKGMNIGRNGTFLVIRHLEQHKDAFDQYVAKQATRIADDANRSPGFTGPELEHWVAARMVGRWRDGTSLVRFPHPPQSSQPLQSQQTQQQQQQSQRQQPLLGDTQRRPDNEFRFGREDPDGLRCPLGAHIRRANPRDSFEPGSSLQLAITNRHRILRVGRVYESEPKKAAGLLFMCVNADIERQFEFLQQTWILGPNFHGLDDEIDPIVGYRGRSDSMTVPTPRGPVRLKGLEKFVTTLGGGYFFLPSRSALRALSD